MSDVIVYTTDACAYCGAAKKLLSKRGVPFEERHLDQDGKARLVAQTGMSTVPQIFVHGALIGGYDQLRALDNDGRLPSLLAQRT
jgi:glutaredoxin 3